MTEPQALAEIITHSSNLMRVVLVGDDLQLQPCIMSAKTSELGRQIQTAFMTKLKAQGNTSLVKLTHNLRSHPHLVEWIGHNIYKLPRGFASCYRNCPVLENIMRPWTTAGSLKSMFKPHQKSERWWFIYVTGKEAKHLQSYPYHDPAGGRALIELLGSLIEKGVEPHRTT